MDEVDILIYGVNGILVVVVIFLGGLLVRYGSLFSYAIGEGEKQLELQKKILKVIAAIFFLALLAVIFNALII